MSDRTVRLVLTGSSASALAALESVGIKAEEEGAKTKAAFGDRLAGPISQTGSLFQRVGTAMGSFGLPFSESVSKMGEKIGDAETKGQKFSQTMQSIGKVALVAGAAGFAVAAGESLKLGINFQQSIAQLAATAGIPVQVAQKIGSAFLDTAGKSTFSGQEMMAAYAPVAAQLASVQGHVLSVAESTQFMRSATDLAEASGSDLTSTAASLAATMQAYGIKTGQASKATDSLYNISRLTNTPLATLTPIIDRLKGRLGDLTPSLQDVGTLMAFPAVASQGSRGAMVVSTALQTLLGNTKPVNTQLSSLGVHIFDASGKFVGMQSVIGQLQPKLAAMTDAQRMAAEKTLFGASAAQLMGQVVAGGVSGYDQASKAVTKVGTAHEAAEKQASTFKGTLEKLKSTGEDLGTKFGMFLLPIVTRLGQVIASVTNFFMQHRTAAIAVGVVIGILVAGPIAAYIASMVAAAAATLVAAAPFIAIIAACVAVGVAIYELVSNWTTVWAAIKAVASDVWHFLDGIWHGIDADIRTIWGGIENFFKQWWPLILGVFTGGIGTVVGEVIQHWQQIVDFFTGFPAKMASIGSHMWDWILDAFRSVEHGVAAIWNDTVGSLSFHIPSWVPGVGGDGFSMPKIPVLDTGGLVKGPMLAGLAQNSVPEIVSPVPQLKQAVTDAIRQASNSGRQGSVGKSVTIGSLTVTTAATSPAQTADAITWRLNRLVA